MRKNIICGSEILVVKLIPISLSPAPALLKLGLAIFLFFLVHLKWLKRQNFKKVHLLFFKLKTKPLFFFDTICQKIVHLGCRVDGSTAGLGTCHWPRRCSELPLDLKKKMHVNRSETKYTIVSYRLRYIKLFKTE